MTPERLAALKGVRVAVIGDVMVDEYLDGHVERISPEAPVPIVRGGPTRAVAGGAANVAANIAALGAQTILVGLVGQDGPSLFTQLLTPHGSVELGGLVVDPSRRTTRSNASADHSAPRLRAATSRTGGHRQRQHGTLFIEA